MDKFAITLLISLFLSTTLDAQWYYRKCGLTDINDCTSREYYCLIHNAETLVQTGKIMIGSSAIFIVPGFIALSSRKFNTYIGYVCSIVSLIPISIGFGIVSEGVLRLAAVENTPYYKSLPPESLKISPTIRINQFNNTHYLGLSLSFSF